MKLIDLIKNINDLDEDLIIFIASKEYYESDIILDYPPENDSGIKEREGIKFYYLIEVFLAKEFIEDWTNSLDFQPSDIDIAKRLFEYGINDA